MKDNIEKEIKIELDKTTFEKTAKELWKGIVLSGSAGPQFLQERNIFYSVPAGFLRLRDYDGEVSVTYKGERQNSESINAREEIEFKYPEQDFDKLKLFFSKVGLVRYFEYTKQRANYYFDGGGMGGMIIGAVASFDILPNGKRYIEIEDLLKESEETIPHLVKILKLENYPIEKRSYLDIVREGVKNGKNKLLDCLNSKAIN